jgi:hypothetical protein
MSSSSPETQTLLFTQPDGQQYFKWLDGTVYSVDDLKTLMSMSIDPYAEKLLDGWKNISPLAKYSYDIRQGIITDLYDKAVTIIKNLCITSNSPPKVCSDTYIFLNHMRIINTNLQQFYKLLVDNKKVAGFDSQVFQISDTVAPSEHNPTYPLPPYNNTTVEVAEIAFIYFYMHVAALTMAAENERAAKYSTASGGRRKSNKNRKSKKSKKTLRRKRRQ